MYWETTRYDARPMTTFPISEHRHLLLVTNWTVWLREQLTHSIRHPHGHHHHHTAYRNAVPTWTLQWHRAELSAWRAKWRGGKPQHRVAPRTGDRRWRHSHVTRWRHRRRSMSAASENCCLQHQWTSSQPVRGPADGSAGLWHAAAAAVAVAVDVLDLTACCCYVAARQAGRECAIDRSRPTQHHAPFTLLNS